MSGLVNGGMVNSGHALVNGGAVRSATPAVSAFVYDTFTGTPATALQSHTGEIGATWTKLSGTNMTINTISGLSCAVYGAGNCTYTASGTPPSANYIITATLVIGTSGNSGDVGLLTRIADNNNYYFWYTDNSATRTILIKRVAGTLTNISVQSWAYPAVGSHTVSLSVNGTTLVVKVDGVTIHNSTDSSLSAAGNAGLGWGIAGTWGWSDYQAVGL